MQFENDMIATLKMVFTAEPSRRVKFFGSGGEAIWDMPTGTIEVKPYFGEKAIYDVASLNDAGWGHAGGDAERVNSMYEILIYIAPLWRNRWKAHLMGIATEESRLDGGKVVPVHQIINCVLLGIKQSP